MIINLKIVRVNSDYCDYLRKFDNKVAYNKNEKELRPFIGILSPITIIQMLWINMVMDTFAGLAFSYEPPLIEYMDEYPKKKNFPKSVYKAAYGLVEYATNQFEENTKKIEEFVIALTK